MRIGKRTEIARLIDEVFDYVADTRNETKWHPRVRSIEKTSEGPIGVGTTFRGDYKGSGEMDFSLVEYERPTHLRFIGGNRQVSIDATIDFRDHHGQTHQDLRPRPAAQRLFPALDAADGADDPPSVRAGRAGAQASA